MTFTPGAYELFEETIFHHYDKSITRIYSITNKSSRSSGQNINKLIVEESLSIKSNIAGFWTMDTPLSSGQ